MKKMKMPFKSDIVALHDAKNTIVILECHHGTINSTVHN